jgi:AraC-like DNA-binding protein
MMNQISLAAAGFSIIALLLLIIQKRTESIITKRLGLTLLCVLMGIQLLQGLYVAGYLILADKVILFYLLLLGFVGPLFYLYSQHVLEMSKPWSMRESGHFIPVIAVSFAGFNFPEFFNLFYSFMFLLGGLYMSQLAWSLYKLRIRRTLFKMEFLFTSVFLSWAIAVVLIGILSAQAMSLLIPIQTITLSIAIAAAIHIQLNYPHLLSSLEEIAHRQYQASTLLNVDCEKVKLQLDELMINKQVYQDTELSLSALADMLSLKSHQLSEFINLQLGMSFSSYLRQQRVSAAEAMLKTEPDVSVLAVGLSVGFSSQSAFYSAFKEFHSIAPGQYRQQMLP